MNNLQETLKRIDSNVNAQRPSTMDELIKIVHSTDGAGNYGTSFKIVKYMGYTQGVRVYVTARSKTHSLPAKDKVYAIHNGLEHFEKAGWVEIQN